jgi:hypothetical protein
MRHEKYTPHQANVAQPAEDLQDESDVANGRVYDPGIFPAR